MGRPTYGPVRVLYYKNEKLILGNFVSIASGVKFVLGGGHEMGCLFSFPIRKFVLKQKVTEALCKGPIIIGDDVWIGLNATILSGVNVGKGAVIAAGSVVTKDIPPYAVVGGVPAKVIRYRFERDVIERLNNIDFSRFSDELIRDNIDQFVWPVSLKVLDVIENSLYANGK